jgi:hypothetical protein
MQMNYQSAGLGERALLLPLPGQVIRSGGGHNLQGVSTPARLLAQATFLASRGRHVEDAAWLALAIGAAASLATSFWL